jgi:hypothetical protein
MHELRARMLDGRQMRVGRGRLIDASGRKDRLLIDGGLKAILAGGGIGGIAGGRGHGAAEGADQIQLGGGTQERC